MRSPGVLIARLILGSLILPCLILPCLILSCLILEAGGAASAHEQSRERKSEVTALLEASRSEKEAERLAAIERLCALPSSLRAPHEGAFFRRLIAACGDPTLTRMLRSDALSVLRGASPAAARAILEELTSPRILTGTELEIMTRALVEITAETFAPAVPSLALTIERGIHHSRLSPLITGLGSTASPLAPTLLARFRTTESRYDRVALARLLVDLRGEGSAEARRHLEQFELDQRLFLATLDRDLGKAVFWLEAGANLDAPFLDENAFLGGGKSRYTPLMITVLKGDLPLLKELLARRPNLELERDGRTALRMAVELRSTDVVDLLVAAGAREDPVAMAASLRILCAAAVGFELRPGEGFPAYPGVPRGTFPPEPLEELLTAGGDPNSADEQGNTALMIAANLGLAEHVSTLLKHGADRTRTANNGRTTAFSLADDAGRVEVLRVLDPDGSRRLARANRPAHLARKPRQRHPRTALPLIEVSFGYGPERVEIRDLEDRVVHVVENPRNYTLYETVPSPVKPTSVVRMVKVRPKTPRRTEGDNTLREIPGSSRTATGNSAPMKDGVFQVLRADGTVEFQRVFGDRLVVSDRGEVRLRSPASQD